MIINKFQDCSKDALKAFKEKIFTRYQPNDVLSNTPRCDCSETRGRKYLGVICEHCNKPVLNIREQKLESMVWLEQPRGVAPLINPRTWTILSNHFKKGRFNIIQWLCDTRYPVPEKPPKVYAQLQALGLHRERGYNKFVKNFDEIIAKLLTISDFRKKKQDNQNEMHHILKFLQMNRGKIFSSRMAFPNKLLLVVEDTDMAVYVDSNVPIAIDAIESLIGLDDPLNGYTDEVKQNRVVRAIANMATYYEEFNKKSFSSKEGISRKHLAATRCDWSARAVITKLPVQHYHRELHIPWGVGVGLLRLHLARKLKDRGWLPNEIWRFLNRYATEYNPLLDELFKELISESRHELIAGSGLRGLPAIFQRNPSLGLGSMQLLYITKVKPDAADQTISLSDLIVRGFNADQRFIVTVITLHSVFRMQGAVWNTKARLKVKITLGFTWYQRSSTRISTWMARLLTRVETFARFHSSAGLTTQLLMSKLRQGTSIACLH